MACGLVVPSNTLLVYAIIKQLLIACSHTAGKSQRLILVEMGSIGNGCGKINSTKKKIHALQWQCLRVSYRNAMILSYLEINQLVHMVLAHTSLRNVGPL